MQTKESVADARMAVYRKEHFVVECKPSQYHKGELCLSATTNGYQWTTVSFLPHEAKAAVKVLREALKKIKEGK